MSHAMDQSNFLERDIARDEEHSKGVRAQIPLALARVRFRLH